MDIPLHGLFILGQTVDPGAAFDWFKNSALVAVLILLIFGYLVPKPTHDDVKAQRDKAQAQRDETITVMVEMKGTMQESVTATKEAVSVMKDVINALDGQGKEGQGHKRIVRPGQGGG